MDGAIGTAFISQFLHQTLLAAAVASLWLTFPGWLVLRALGWQRHYRGALALLLSPVLGICSFAPFSLVIATWRYRRVELIAAWIVFNLAALLAASRRTHDVPVALMADRPVHLKPLASLLLPAACVFFALMVAQNIFPAVRNNGLYVNEMLFDHTKVAIGDAMVRQGFPVKNPFYAPGGKHVLLTYYYLWHFLASQMKVLVGVDGWPADVAMTAYTSFAAAGLLVVLAVQLSGRAAAGFVVLLMASITQIADPLLPIIFPSYPQWGTTKALFLPLWLQCVWVPQHVVSAFAVVLGMMLLADIAQAPDSPTGAVGRVTRAAVLGFFCAAAAGSSFWIGAIALTCAQPMILLALRSAQLDRARWMAILKTAAWSIPIALLTFAPILYPQIVSPKPQKQPIVLSIWPATIWPSIAVASHWFTRFAAGAAQITLFWIAYLPLTLGVCVVVGLPALLARTGDSAIGPQTLRRVAGFCGFGFLLVAQFIKSRVVYDDLGWRAPIVSMMLLAPWAAAALVELTIPGPIPPAWNPRSLFVRWRPLTVPLAWGVLILGLISTVLFYHTPLWRGIKPHQLAARHDLLLQQRAWRDVRRFAGPADLVQANPDGFIVIGVQPGQLTQALFSNRATAYGGLNGVRTFAYGYDPMQRQDDYLVLHRIFAGQPRPLDIPYLHDVLGVKVVLVNRIDNLWASSALQRSSLYRLALQRPYYRIYVARPAGAAAPSLPGLRSAKIESLKAVRTMRLGIRIACRCFIKPRQTTRGPWLAIGLR
jgi:hypothetical protein